MSMETPKTPDEIKAAQIKAELEAMNKRDEDARIEMREAMKLYAAEKGGAPTPEPATEPEPEEVVNEEPRTWNEVREEKGAETKEWNEKRKAQKKETLPARELTLAESENEEARKRFFEMKKYIHQAGHKVSDWKKEDQDKYVIETIKRKAEYTATKSKVVAEFLNKGEKENAQEFLLQEVELKRKSDLESGMAGKGERLKAGISNGIEAWDNFGKNEEGAKGYVKRVAKTTISLALIGAVSSLSVQGLANMGIGTASALSGGISSYLGKKIVLGAAVAAVIEKIPPTKKKWVMGILLAGGAGLTIATGGLFAGGVVVASSAIGLGVARLTKKYEKKIENRMQDVKEKGVEKIDIDDLEAGIAIAEKEIEQALKKAETTRILGKLAEGAVAITTSAGILEMTGMVRDYTQPDAPTKAELEKQHNDEIAKNQSDSEVNSNSSNESDNSNKGNDSAPAKPEAPAGPDTSGAKDAIKDLAVVHKGEGIEHAFIRQIEQDPELAKQLGFTGGPSDLHAFAQDKAHFIAIKEGYVSNTGAEVRVSAIDKASYEIKIDADKNISVEEKLDGKLIETHKAGDEFEGGKTEKEYEYTKNKTIQEHKIVKPSHEPEHHAVKPKHHITNEPEIKLKAPPVTEKTEEEEVAADQPVTTKKTWNTGKEFETGVKVNTGVTVGTGGVTVGEEAISVPDNTVTTEEIKPVEDVKPMPEPSPVPKSGATPATPTHTPEPKPTPEEMKIKEIKSGIETSMDTHQILEKHPELIGTPFEKNPYNLTEKQLLEVNEVHNKNINDLTESKWEFDKDAQAKNYLGSKIEDDKTVQYLNKLYKETGREIQTVTDPITGKVRFETIEEYVVGALGEAAKKGVLNAVKYQ